MRGPNMDPKQPKIVVLLLSGHPPKGPQLIETATSGALQAQRLALLTSPSNSLLPLSSA